MHDVIKNLSTEEWLTCDQIATKSGIHRSTVYSILRDENHVEVNKDKRVFLYRRKASATEVPAFGTTTGRVSAAVPNVESRPVSVPKPVSKARAAPQVLTKRIEDLTLKVAFLRRIGLNIALADKKIMESIVQDLELIKSCS